MNYYDYLRQSRTQSHDKRYHPHGVTERTRCKYRGFGAVDPHVGESGDDGKNYEYPSFESADAARKWLYETTDIEPFHITYPKQIITEFGFSPLTAAEFTHIGKPVSQEVYDADCLVLASVCKDLLDRYGEISFPPSAFLPYNFWGEKRKYRGLATLDLRRGFELYLSIGDFQGVSESAFGHSASELPFDVARHELGHNLATMDVVARFAEISKEMSSERTGGIENVLRGKIRRESENDPEEEIADIFSLCLSPLYEKGSLPSVLEDFCEGMLRQDFRRIMKGFTMDEKPRKPRSAEALPYAYKISLCYRPPAPKGVISWFDRVAWEYVTFKTYREKMRYAMQKVLIPTELQQKVLDSAPNREWSDFDFWYVLNFYYSGYDYAEIVDYFKPEKQEQA